MKAVHILVNGRVQGVWYRASTCREAQRLNLSGWVRNLEDGRVEILAQGSEAEVDELCLWCESGPPGARVTAVQIEPVTVDASLIAFTVLY